MDELSRQLGSGRLEGFVRCASFHASDSAHGDEIALEGVVAKRVSGRTVAIGKGCEIDLMQYSETMEISPDAKVGRTEQI